MTEKLVWIVNNNLDEVRYVAEGKELAQEIANILEREKESSNRSYWVTSASMVKSIEDISKFEYLDAEKEDGEELIYFHNSKGWFRIYVNVDHADRLAEDMGYDYWKRADEVEA